MHIETKALTKRFHSSSLWRKSTLAVQAAHININPGESVGLFGESGSGKTTLGMMIAGLLKPSSGSIFINQKEFRLPYRGHVRRDLQVLFQHPEVSFNPVLPLRHSMVEPYRLCGIKDVEARLSEDLARFGLNMSQLERKPHALSGGELQRAALARLLVLKPKLIVLDEPTSMLDVITQAQIMNMLKTYQREHGTSYLFITHNRSLCEHLCDRIYHVHQGLFREEQ